MKLTKDKVTGYWKVRIWTEHGPRTLTTRCTNKDDASAVVSESGLKQAELSARAGQLTAEAISRILTGRKITLQGAMDCWLERLACRGRSPRTVHNYRLFVQSFARDHARLMPSAVTEQHVNDWLNRKGNAQKAGSQAVRLTAMRSFLEYCQDKGWCAGNAANLVEVNYTLLSHEQKEPKQRMPFTDEEVARLLERAEDSTFWYAAILIGRHIGLRLGDIASLEWSCFQKPGRIIVWTDKHDRRIDLPLEPDQLVAEISTLPKLSTVYLFPEQREIAQDVARRSALSTQFTRLCEKVGIEGKSFHNLRHAYATACQQAGQPLWYISQSLGHARQSTTMGYLHE